MHQFGDMMTLCALRAGIAVPFLYYGMQALAAPFFPDFSFLGTTASELGSELSKHPSLFNVGIFLLGVASFIASVGFFRALARLNAHPLLSWSTSIAVAVVGISSMWAAYYPLPHPRHGGPPVFLIAMLFIPLLIAVALWKSGHVMLSVSHCELVASRRDGSNHEWNDGDGYAHLSWTPSASLRLHDFSANRSGSIHPGGENEDRSISRRACGIGKRNVP
jgi:hypothetical membrane protein